jgi:hypothetical protein
MKKHLILVITLSIFSVGIKAQNAAQTTIEESSKNWQFLIEPYLMFPNMNGTSGLGALPEVSVDANAGDIFSKLQIGAMLNTEAYFDKWTIGSDIIYMSLKQNVESGLLIANGNLKAKQFAWGVFGLYKVAPWLDLGIGGNFNSLKLETDLYLNNLGGVTNRRRNITQTWFDPMIIAKTSSKRSEKFIYQLRADIGGFGLGSRFAYQVQAYVGYRFSEVFQLTGGYRVIGADYEKNNDSDVDGILNNNRFLYDMTTFGPVIRLGFNL